MPAVEPFCLSSNNATPDQLAEMVAAAAHWNGEALQALLDAQPVPIYLTDDDGWITFFNRACINFAGRTPVPGQDRWCVTWRLHTEAGEPLPHDQCPMAVAVRERRRVRGAVAFAERPDGTRVLFAPFPTPIVDETGASAGAVNILVDVTDARQADALRAQALRCRRLASSVSDPQTVNTLTLMAADYENKARTLANS